jgi:hypothetical protein
MLLAVSPHLYQTALPGTTPRRRAEPDIADAVSGSGAGCELAASRPTKTRRNLSVDNGVRKMDQPRLHRLRTQDRADLSTLLAVLYGRNERAPSR